MRPPDALIGVDAIAFAVLASILILVWCVNHGNRGRDACFLKVVASCAAPPGLCPCLTQQSSGRSQDSLRLKVSTDVPSSEAAARKRTFWKSLTHGMCAEDPTAGAIIVRCLLIAASVAVVPFFFPITPGNVPALLRLPLAVGLAIKVPCVIVDLSPSQLTLAVTGQVAMLAIAGSVFVFLAATSASDPMRLRLLLRTSRAQDVVTWLMLWLVTLGIVGVRLRLWAGLAGAVLSAAAFLYMLTRTISILLSPRAYSDSYVNLLAQRYARVVTAAVAYHTSDRSFRDWIADRGRSLGAKFLGLAIPSFTKSCALVQAQQGGRIETVDVVRLEKTLKQLLSDGTVVAPLETCSEGPSSTTGERCEPDKPVVFAFFPTPGRDVEQGDVLMAIGTSYIRGGMLSRATVGSILRCYDIGDRARSFAADVEAEQDALRDRTLHCIDSNLIWEARVARRSYEKEFKELLSGYAQFEVFKAGSASALATQHNAERDSWEELDDFTEAVREISRHGCSAVEKAVMRVLVGLPYSLARLAQDCRAADPFWRCCSLMSGQAVEMWKTAPRGLASLVGDELRGFDVRNLELLLFGVPKELSDDSAWQDHFSWLVNETDAVLSTFLWLLRDVCSDHKTTRSAADSLEDAMRAYPTAKSPLLVQVPTLDEMRRQKPASLPDASGQLSSFVRGRGTAICFAVFGFALENARSRGEPMTLSPEDVKLEALSSSIDFVRAYSAAESVAEAGFPSWEFWRSETQEDARMIETSRVLAEAAVGAIATLSIRPPIPAWIASQLQRLPDGHERLHKVFGENSNLASVLKEAIGGRLGWHEALPQADTDQLNAWLAFAAEAEKL